MRYPDEQFHDQLQPFPPCTRLVWMRGHATMKLTRSPAVRTDVAKLEDIPNVGVSIAGDLRRLGIRSPDDLPGRNPYALYDELCRITRKRHDPCLLDTFIAAVRYMEGGPKKPWWQFTAERKRTLAARERGDQPS